MDDIIVRLRKWPFSPGAVPASDIMDEAADEIERLRRIVAMWEDCAFKNKDLYGNVFVPRTSTYDGGVKRIVSGEWSAPKVSTGHTGNQWFTIPEPPGHAVTEPMPVVVSSSGSVTPVPYAKNDEKRVDWHTAGETNHDAAPAAKAMHSRDCSGGLSGTGDSLSKAEIDALQHVVEDGRIVKMQDYGCLRSLLVRLRPEWEDEDDSDRSKPINDERLAALERLSALDQELERTHGVRHTQAECTKQDECSVIDSRTENKPAAWLVNGAEYDTGCEYEYVTLMKEKAEIAAENGANVIPLFDGPQTWQEEVSAVENAFERSGVKPTLPDDEPGNIGPMAAAMADEIARLRITDAEREAVEAAARIIDAYEDEMDGFPSGASATLRGLLERTK